MEALLAQAETEPNPDRRRTLFKQILTKSAEDIPEIFIGSVPRFFAVRDYVKGFETDDAGRFMVWEGGAAPDPGWIKTIKW